MSGGVDILLLATSKATQTASPKGDAMEELDETQQYAAQCLGTERGQAQHAFEGPTAASNSISRRGVME